MSARGQEKYRNMLQTLLKKYKNHKITSRDQHFGDSLIMQTITLSDEDKLKLSNARIALAGVGGIGCALLELLVRNRIQYLKIADQDTYEKTDARQLFMTTSSVGHKKVDIAEARILEINPDVQVEIYEEGVTSSNCLDFCRGVDIISNQTDDLTAFIALNYAGEQLRLPVVHAGRAKWPDRHLLTVDVHDYRQQGLHFCMTTKEISEKWGVDEESIRSYISCLENREDNPPIRERINKQNREFRRATLRRLLEEGDTTLISQQSRDYLLSVIKIFPDRFDKMAISPEECFAMSSMATAVIKDILLNRPYNTFAIDLTKGAAIAPYGKNVI